jgi:nucleoside-diphosphate kinase
VIKPHILKEHRAGQIVDRVLSAGFEVSALQIVYLDQQTSQEFIDVYKVRAYQFYKKKHIVIYQF